MFARFLLLAAVALLASSPARAEKLRLAYVDALSGPAGGNGVSYLNNFKAILEIANRDKWAGDEVLELVEFDGKGTVQESLLQLKNASDQGMRYLVQGTSSAVGLALTDAVNKYNERNPGKEILYLDFLNAAPELTNENCSFWHFRFAPHTNMVVEALISSLARDKSLKKVYILNQNYATGQASAVAMRSALKRLRPDIEIVGDDFHPMLQVKDFSPYVAKIKASGAEAVLTANWGGDLSLLLKAAKDSSLKLPFYTVNSASRGIPSALVSAGIDGVKNASYWHANDDIAAAKEIVESYRKKYDDDFWGMPIYTTVAMLSRALREAKSTDTTKVALALEGMKAKVLNVDVEMRKSDHQALQSIIVAGWTKLNGRDVVYDQEKTGYGWKTLEKLSAAETTPPTSCQMSRPK